jgi:hypothetical protein
VEYWNNTEEVSLQIYGGENPELYGLVSLYHHLKNSLIWDDEVEYMNKLFDKWDELHPDLDSYEKVMNTFYDAILKVDSRKNSPVNREWNTWCFSGEHFSHYTYNDENALNQDFIYYVMGEWCFIQIHGGCDARGGFTRPKLFKFYQDSLFDYDRYSFVCENRDEHHYWDVDGYHSYYTETDFDMGKSRLIDYEWLTDEAQIEFDETGFVMENGEIIYATEGQEIFDGFDVRLKKPSEGSYLIIKDKVAYCPICGEKLYAIKYWSN